MLTAKKITEGSVFLPNKDWKTFLTENGYSVLQVFYDVHKEDLIDAAREHAERYYPSYAETLTEADYEKIAEDYKSLYCEHEIASNVWADVLDEWAKEHGWKERDA